MSWPHRILGNDRQQPDRLRVVMSSRRSSDELRAPQGKRVGIGAAAADVGEQLSPVTRRTP
jgi:hypothetical protein